LHHDETHESDYMSENLRQLYSSLTLAQAEDIIDAALAARLQYQLLPLAAVVLDSGGHIVAFKREDGCANLRFEIARGKASAALGMGMSTRLIRDRLAARPAFQSAIATASQGQFIPVPGGVLILDAAGVAIGAVGISGDTSDKDEYCAITSVLAAGLACEPALPNPDWMQSAL
jgi:glc operon protein GlcG